jgi:hypothetical protein
MNSALTLSRRGFSPAGVLPASVFQKRAVRGHDLADLRSLGIMPGIAGGARGINAAGDILTETANGVPLNDLWNAYQEMLAPINARRDPLFNFLTWRTQKAREDLIGAGKQVDFEEASEYGEPVGVRPEAPPTTSMGYTFKWYDLGARFTWQFLADADSQQVDAIANLAGEASNRLNFMQVMKTLFNNTRRTNKEGITVYPAYAGVNDAADTPPPVGTTTFAASHQHYVTNNSATLTPVHFEALQTLVLEHDYTRAHGYTLVCLINKAQEGTIRNFRSTANGGTGTYDFVAAQGTSPLLLPTNLQLDTNSIARPPSTMGGLEVVGSYDQTIFVKSEFIPAGYLVLFATGGADNVQNPIAVREHAKQALRGLRLVKGRTPDYPLIDSFYQVGMGTGVRYRGALAIMQIVASATYTVPAQYIWTA